MKYGKLSILTACVVLLMNCSVSTGINTRDVEMLYWESQSWESGGGSSRLSIWADGSSEIRVVPERHFLPDSELIRIREGWIAKQGSGGLFFVREGVFSLPEGKRKFEEALKAGITQLQSFQADYTDGGGTAVGVQTNGELQTTVIPMFSDRRIGSANHRRFVAVANILADFDRDASDWEE